MDLMDTPIKQKSIQPYVKRFTFQFSHADGEAWEWFSTQPHKGAYLKALILADKARRESCGEPLSLVTRRDRLDAAWDTHFELLQAFSEEHGRLPASDETYRGFNIGRWLNSQQKKKDALPHAQRERLERLGALDGKWEQMYRLASAFRDEFDRLPAPNEVYRGVRIGRWLESQQKQYAESDSPRAEKLRALGVVRTKWERNLAILQAFTERHGRLPKYLDRHGGAQIGRWLNYQCKTLDPAVFPERAKKLCALGAVLKKASDKPTP